MKKFVEKTYEKIHTQNPQKNKNIDRHSGHTEAVLDIVVAGAIILTLPTGCCAILADTASVVVARRHSHRVCGHCDAVVCSAHQRGLGASRLRSPASPVCSWGRTVYLGASWQVYLGVVVGRVGAVSCSWQNHLWCMNFGSSIYFVLERQS